jgi:hypothetical protein
MTAETVPTPVEVASERVEFAIVAKHGLDISEPYNPFVGLPAAPPEMSDDYLIDLEAS